MLIEFRKDDGKGGGEGGRGWELGKKDAGRGVMGLTSITINELRRRQNDFRCRDLFLLC